MRGSIEHYIAVHKVSGKQFIGINGMHTFDTIGGLKNSINRMSRYSCYLTKEEKDKLPKMWEEYEFILCISKPI